MIKKTGIAIAAGVLLFCGACGTRVGKQTNAGTDGKAAQAHSQDAQLRGTRVGAETD